MRNFKNIIDFHQKQRSWDENIGRLIVFAMTIIIAVWLVWLLAYYYDERREQAVQMAVLWSSAATLEELENIWVVKENAYSGGVHYDTISWNFVVWCDSNDCINNQTFEDNGSLRIIEGDCDEVNHDAEDCIEYTTNNR